MLSLIGSLLGFGTSFLPKIMDYLQDRQDKKHELAVMERQTERQERMGEMALKTRNVDADIAESRALIKHSRALQGYAAQWVVNLAATVRPLITYLLFGEFFVLTWLLALGMIDGELYRLIWNSEIQAVWAAVISFWFGSRTFSRQRQT